jgi:hypothetical protein
MVAGLYGCRTGGSSPASLKKHDGVGGGSLGSRREQKRGWLLVVST